MTYAEKLKDPRWQRKRLEVFKRDNFTCTVKGCTNHTLPLHVHHIRYFWGQDPWDTPIKYLKTLCEVHHDAAHGLRILKRKLYARGKRK